jgi:hypothetical protein
MKNRYHVDIDYFKKELAALSQSLENRTPEELQRYLMKLADVAKPIKEPATFRIDYDDDQMNTLAIAEKALNTIGINIEFKDDNLPHDGFMIFSIVEKL